MMSVYKRDVIIANFDNNGLHNNNSYLNERKKNSLRSRIFSQLWVFVLLSNENIRIE